MKEAFRKERICSKCGKAYSAIPAMSRESHMPICPDCGTREALASMGVNESELEQILQTIHRCYQPC